MSPFDLDAWLPDPVIAVRHRRVADASPDVLWAAAARLSLSETRVLGRLVRWRIPGLPAQLSYFDLFAAAPFVTLASGPHAFMCALCGRIWTLRRDYPELDGPEAFRAFAEPGTVRVVFANWVAGEPDGRAAILSETRVAPIDRRGRLGLRAVEPLIRGFEQLIATEAMSAIVRDAQQAGGPATHPLDDGPTIRL